MFFFKVCYEVQDSNMRQYSVLQDSLVCIRVWGADVRQGCCCSLQRAVGGWTSLMCTDSGKREEAACPVLWEKCEHVCVSIGREVEKEASLNTKKKKEIEQTSLFASPVFCAICLCWKVQHKERRESKQGENKRTQRRLRALRRLQKRKIYTVILW